MTTLNIINTFDITAYLRRFCEGDARLEIFLISALENIIKKMPECMEPVIALPDDAPPWLVEKWDASKSWHRFNEKRNIRLAGRVYDAVNWIMSAIEYEMDWVKRLDSKGRPRKLLQISTLEQLDDVMRKDEKRISQKLYLEAKQNFINGELSKGFEKVMTFENGYYIVKLKSTEALDMEGAYLEHCIGNGDYDYCLGGNVTEFYSLRDKDDLPCLSMRVEKDPYRQLAEISGRRNSYPKTKFIPYIATFCNQAIIDMAGAFSFDEGYEFLRDQ